jgi:benzylsuccinate CoA-transferase BbsE subunit
MLLNGISVVDWSGTLPGAFCARLLGDLGAEVIKLEPPGAGDPLRRCGPFLPATAYGEDGALFAYVNHGKRGVTLDPSQASGMALLRRLLALTDVLVESQPAALLEQLGLSAEGLRAINPALVVVSVTALGRGVEERATTDLTLTHHAGYAFHQSRPVQSPDAQPPVAGADREVALAAGVAAANAALCGILEVQQGGAGQHIDCAQADVIAHLLIEPVADYGRGEREFSRLRENLRGTEVAGGLIWLLPCRDGFVMVSPREQHQWDRWVDLLGRPAWASDTALCGDRDARTANWSILQDEMSTWTRQHLRAEVFARAQTARVACFPVSGPRDLLENEQLRAREFFDELHTRGGGTLPMPGLPFDLRTSGGKSLARARQVRAPALGEANADILERRLGVSRQALETLRLHGVV